MREVDNLVDIFAFKDGVLRAILGPIHIGFIFPPWRILKGLQTKANT